MAQDRIMKSSLCTAPKTSLSWKFCALGEKSPLERRRQRKVPALKRRYFAVIGFPSVKTTADRYRHVAYYNKRWSRAF